MTIAAPNSMLGGFNLWDFTRAVKASDLPPVERHLLHVLALTPAKGSDGTCSGPDFSYPRLAESTGYSRRTVTRALVALVRDSWVTRISNGPGRRNSYRIHVPGSAAEVIHNRCHSDTGSDPDPCHRDTGTRVTVTPLPCHRDTPDLSLPLLTRIPSIVESARARVRAACPDLQPDDDDLSTLIANLETRSLKPVRNVAAYLQGCPPADIRRLLIEAAAQPPAAPPATQPGPDAPASPDCVHGYDGGLTRAGTPRCPVCRRIAAQRSASLPFTAALDEGDRAAPQGAAESPSGLVSAAVTA